MNNKMNVKKNKNVIIVIILSKRPVNKDSISIYVVLGKRTTTKKERNLSDKLKIRFQRSFSVICQWATRSK